jgi:hypothetical protein
MLERASKMIEAYLLSRDELSVRYFGRTMCVVGVNHCVRVTGARSPVRIITYS